MTTIERFQVTALFDNVYEVVGADTVDWAEACRLYRIFTNVGRAAHVYRIVGDGSVLVDSFEPATKRI